MSGIEYVHRKSEDERRAIARRDVAARARRGESPSSVFPSDDLEWAFDGGYEHELAELERLAVEQHEAHIEQEARSELGRALNAETEAVLREWDERERSERWQRAHAEAKKRLGVE